MSEPLQNRVKQFLDLEAAIGRLPRDKREETIAGFQSELLPTAAQLFKGSSAYAQSIRNKATRLSLNSHPVLIHGPSGAGKEQVARILHSSKGKSPFIAINCAAIPDTLFESELFGHKAGTFTGAARDKEGLFLAAKDGTIFLDEIGEMPAQQQAKLLRVLQTRKVRPVGSYDDHPFTARIIAATNRQIKRDQSYLRLDLYERLATFEIKLLPIRHHLEDISDITTPEFFHTLRNMFPPDSLRFSGNVRQVLRIHNRVEELGFGDIQPEDLN